MFRLTRFLKSLADDSGGQHHQMVAPTGPVVIWNLVRRCNLTCKHCYSTSADKDFQGELSGEEVGQVMLDLKDFGVPVLILSGGEPLMRPDIFDISRQAKAMGFYTALSSNGTLISEENIGAIQAVGYDYVGISLDGIAETHDRFRRRQGAFDEALRGIRLCRDAGVKVGIRFTLTAENAADLPGLLHLMEAEGIEKFYLSHLNYAGRGNRNRAGDAHFRVTRYAMELLFDTCWNSIRSGKPKEFVTGNNDADGVFLLHWIRENQPDKLARILPMLRRWGGNASGVHVANIDNQGNVHPDTMWWDYNLGNVRDRPFSAIWRDESDPLMAGLKKKRRPLEGRCARCSYLDICGGNSRTRAWQLTGNFWAEDPGCYLTDEEIGLSENKNENIPMLEQRIV
ncbi:MAG: heme d1 biosynthesis radical SAM protein NirJ [Gammaproteobacteria bacterium]|nr:heme d1 biosynthesis radical SAM protein NirJ [Gammaproteobacteria bacterium]MBU1655900.1 heme d1 biosynthesis radical SAM protein NirJ [Gammaproteobacteria bacterium]MBU1961003.1 heme d1 biosynthesis radical SAM protein NirJ [Gammaproteobacteria bacterium]